MYKTYQAAKLAVFELKMLLFIMMTEELNWELPPEFRGILEHRTWRLRFLGPNSFLHILQNEIKSREPAHTTDKLLSPTNETLVPVDSLHLKFTPLLSPVF